MYKSNISSWDEEGSANATPKKAFFEHFEASTSSQTIVPRGNVIVYPSQISARNNGNDDWKSQGTKVPTPKTVQEEVQIIPKPPKKKFLIQQIQEERNDKTESNKEVQNKKKVTKPFVCSICNKEFRHKSYFDYHKRTHTGERTHRCHLCEKGFFERSKLNRHLISCHNLKNYAYQSEEDDKISRTCSQCQKTFSRVSGLQAHLLTHDKIRPFACTKCEQKFSGLTALKNHEKIHVGVKSNMCEICGKVFLLKKYLSLHLKTTHKLEDRGHKCTKCWKEFHSAKDLKRHQLMHSNEKKFACNLCKASFKRKDNYNRHLKLTHLLTPEHVQEELEESGVSEVEIIEEVAPSSLRNEEVRDAPTSALPRTPPPRQVSVIKSTHEFMLSLSRREAQF